MDEALAARDTWDPAWLAASDIGDAELHLTAGPPAALNDDLQAVIERYRAREDHVAPDAERVTVLYASFPTRSPRCEPTPRRARAPRAHAVTTLDARSVRRRFLLLRGLRWLPTGLFMPVIVLVMTDRGFTLTQIGVAAAAQGLVVLCLELPTGGLADALGRRPVLLGATIVDLVAVAVFAFWARSLSLLLFVWALQGVYRALESGPLDAWYVDAALAADPDADIEAGLGHAGAALGGAIASARSRPRCWWRLAPFPGIDPLVGPLLVYLALRAVEIAMLADADDRGPRPRSAGGPGPHRPPGPDRRRRRRPAWCATPGRCSPWWRSSCSGASAWSPGRTSCPRASSR